MSSTLSPTCFICNSLFYNNLSIVSNMDIYDITQYLYYNGYVNI